jgi:hypothetical protein
VRRIIVLNSVTLDGVMQGPGRSEEDTRDGFRYGGWAVPYADEAGIRAMGEHMGSGGWLLGRRTYEEVSRVLELGAGQSVRAPVERGSEVHRVEHAHRAVAVAELDAPLRRPGRGGDRTEAGGGRRPEHHGEWIAHPVTLAA